MSTNLNCEYVEYRPGEWYYILEWGSAPKDAWDWREFADASGPFGTRDAAAQHLHNYNANPGGANIYPYTEEWEAFRNNEVVQKLIREATK